MPGIFRLNKEGTVVLAAEAKELCIHLPKVSPELFLYIVLVYDTMDSPYRRKPLIERQHIALNRIYGGKPEKIPEEDPVGKLAIEEMKSIVFDHNKEDREMLLTKLKMLNTDLMAAETSDIRKILESISLIEARVDELDARIDREEEVIILKGDRKLSLIERFIVNRQAYEDKMKSYGINR